MATRTTLRQKQYARQRRHRRIRSRVKGTPHRPRLVVFKSHRHVFLQLVDDSGDSARTLVGVRSNREGGTRADRARAAARQLAARARSLGIEEVVFDRGGYPYHGIVRAVAEVAREEGLRF